jgi:hypothetical protein
MAFLLPILEGVGSGLLGGALGGAVGGVQNGAMNALNAQDETFQLGMYASEVQNQEQMQMQSEVFDQMMNERSDKLRPSVAYSALESLKKLARQRDQDLPDHAHRKASSDGKSNSTTRTARRKY